MKKNNKPAHIADFNVWELGVVRAALDHHIAAMETADFPPEDEDARQAALRLAKQALAKLPSWQILEAEADRVEAIRTGQRRH